jgi:hypothetical protein
VKLKTQLKNVEVIKILSSTDLKQIKIQQIGTEKAMSNKAEVRKPETLISAPIKQEDDPLKIYIKVEETPSE